LRPREKHEPSFVAIDGYVRFAVQEFDLANGSEGAAHPVGNLLIELDGNLHCATPFIN
jgi:hypothetical protein